MRYLLDGGSGALIALSGGRVEPVLLQDLLDPQTGRIRTRLVDVTTEAYRVARDYMVRLKPRDLDDAPLAALAQEVRRTPHEFRASFGEVATL